MSIATKPWPRLSEQLASPLFGGLRPDRCQICDSDADVSLWREHDDRDQPEPICIALCETCSDQCIEPHPRLYTGKAARDGTSSLAHGLADFRDIDRLPEIAARLLSVQIEERDALDVIARFDTPRTLFFVDPPYLPETRCQSRATRGYRHEMTVQDHIALAGTLGQIQGMAVVSGYPSALYDSLYDGWQCVRRQSRTQNFAKKATECLWLSPAAWAGRAQGSLELEATW